MIEILRRKLSEVSTKLGLLIGIAGNLLPYMSPEALTALGVPGPWVPRISTILGFILIIYREKPAPELLPPPVAEATRSPFVKPPENPK